LTTTSGLGSNYTSYTTDPIDSSLNSLEKKNFNPAAPGTSSSFLESDLPTTDEYLYVPEGEHPRFMSPQRMNQNYYVGELEAGKMANGGFTPSLSTDFYIPQQTQQHSTNPFHQQAFVNSGPDSFIDFGQYESEYYAQYLEQPPQPPPKTPIRTPVMGTRTYQHRRTHSNVSSQYSNRTSSQVDYGEVQELDYRFNSFNVSGGVEPPQFHSVPYSCNQPDPTNAHPIPNRMRLYENVSHFQHLRDPSPSMHHQPLKTSYIETNPSPEIVKTSASITNSMRREMFFNSEPAKVPAENVETTTSYSTTKVTGSTGCTPTHSTPQDSFSDDSSYLSALSSQNRVRFSPENFLTESTAFSPTSRAAVATLQRALVLRTLELEEGEKS
jgi:hypothetical protein